MEKGYLWKFDFGGVTHYFVVKDSQLISPHSAFFEVRTMPSEEEPGYGIGLFPSPINEFEVLEENLEFARVDYNRTNYEPDIFLPDVEHPHLGALISVTMPPELAGFLAGLAVGDAVRVLESDGRVYTYNVTENDGFSVWLEREAFDGLFYFMEVEYGSSSVTLYWSLDD